MRDAIDALGQRRVTPLSISERTTRPPVDERLEDPESAPEAAGDAEAAIETVEGVVGQGGYVTSFTMTRSDVAIGAETACTQLPKLLRECAFDTSEGWRRTKSSKSSARIWEKGYTSKTRRATRKMSVPNIAARQLAEDATAVSSSNSIDSPAISTAREENVEEESYAVRSSITVDAPLDLVLKTLDASVLTAHRSFMKIIYGGVVSEASVLSHHDQTHRQSPLHSSSKQSTSESLCVRWLVCRCNSPMISDCDLCLQEYTRRHSIDELAANSTIYNNNNNASDGSDDGSVEGVRSRDGLHTISETPVAYKLFRSVETRFCPVLLESQRLVRCRVPLGGFLFYPTDSSDRTDVVFFMSIAHEHSERQFRALQSVALEMARRVDRLRNAADAYRMNLRLDALRSTRWVDDSARPQCAVCARRFHQLSRRRHHCRLCGEVICRDCSVHKDADLPTIGLTVLRICKLCETSTVGVGLQSLQAVVGSPVPVESSASSSSASNRTVSKRTSRRGSSERMPALDVAHASHQGSIEVRGVREVPPVPIPRTPAAKPDKRPIQDRRGFATAIDIAIGSADGGPQAFSCPKPTEDRRTPIWGSNNSGERMTGKTVAATTPTLKSRVFPAPSPGIWRPVGWTPSRWSNISSSSSNQPSERTAAQNTSAKSSSTALPQSPIQWQQRHSIHVSHAKRVLDSPHKQIITSNQQSEVANITTGLTPRGVANLRAVQDILVDLCTQAAALCGTKYAALSMFRDRTLTSMGSFSSMKSLVGSSELEETDDSTSHRMEHFLKVRGSHKLMNVAPNLLSCEPLLRLRRSVATRNAATARLDYDLKKLPIVSGPQQARFYAGVLLVDGRNQWLGALAVFDARVAANGSSSDSDQELQNLLSNMEELASVAVESIKEREKEQALQDFLRSPLVEGRQSEPGKQTVSGKDGLHRRANAATFAITEVEEAEEVRREMLHSRNVQVSPASNTVSPHALYRVKMRELVLQAQETQSQALENSIAMKRERLIT